MHFSSFFFLLVTTPISLLNNFYFRIIAIFFSPSYPLLLIFLLFFPSHIFPLSFLLFCSIFFTKPLQAWTAARARAHAHAHAHARLSACCQVFYAIYCHFFRKFSQFFAIFATFKSTQRKHFWTSFCNPHIQNFRVFFCHLSWASPSIWLWLASVTLTVWHVWRNQIKRGFTIGIHFTCACSFWVQARFAR